MPALPITRPLSNHQKHEEEAASQVLIQCADQKSQQCVRAFGLKPIRKATNTKFDPRPRISSHHVQELRSFRVPRRDFLGCKASKGARGVEVNDSQVVKLPLLY